MTTAHRVNIPAAPRPGEILVAGVPWPTYKLAALVVGFVVLVIVGMATASASAAVLGAAGAATAVWVGFSAFLSHPER